MDESAAVAAMADALVASGAMTREQIDAGIAADEAGIQLEANSATPEQQQASEPVQQQPQPGPFDGYEVDPAFAPPSSPEGYSFQTQLNSGVEVADIKAAQSLFHAAKMPAPLAQALFSEVEKMAVTNGGQEMSDLDLQMLSQRTMAQLHQAWGDRTDEMLAYGRRFVSEVAKSNSRVREFLEVTGAGSNPVVVRQIAEHAQRIYSSKRK